MPTPISTGTAKTMLHALGIAVQQAVMYGPVHNVSRLAAREAALEAAKETPEQAQARVEREILELADSVSFR